MFRNVTLSTFHHTIKPNGTQTPTERIRWLRMLLLRLAILESQNSFILWGFGGTFLTTPNGKGEDLGPSMWPGQPTSPLNTISQAGMREAKPWCRLKEQFETQNMKRSWVSTIDRYASKMIIFSPMKSRVKKYWYRPTFKDTFRKNGSRASNVH